MTQWFLDLAWSQLRSLGSSIIGGLGWGGCIAVLAGLLLAMAIAARLVKFLHRPSGMLLTAGILVAGLLFMGAGKLLPGKLPWKWGGGVPGLTAPAEPVEDLAKLESEPEAISQVETTPPPADMPDSPASDLSSPVGMPASQGFAFSTPPALASMSAIGGSSSQPPPAAHAASPPPAANSNASSKPAAAPARAASPRTATRGFSTNLPARTPRSPSNAAIGKPGQSLGMAATGGTTRGNAGTAGRSYGSGSMAYGGRTGGGFPGQGNAARYQAQSPAANRAMMNRIAGAQMDAMMSGMMQQQMSGGGMHPMGGMHMGGGHPAAHHAGHH